MSARTPARGGMIALVAAAALAMPGVAQAAYSATGAGTGGAAVATLGTPVIGSATAGGGSVTLRWDAVDAPAGGTVGYVVRRDGLPAGGDCPTVASPTTATSCTDSGAPIGSHVYTVAAVWRSWSSVSDGASATVVSGSAARFALAASSTSPSAGDGVNLTITAQDAQGNTVVGYEGNKSLVFGGAGASPGGAKPVVTDRTGAAVGFGAATSMSFDNGVASAAAGAGGVMRLYKAQSAAVTVGDGTMSNGSGLTMTVAPAAPAATSPVAGGGQTATVSTRFPSPLVALVTDAYGNPVPAVTVTFAAPASGASATFAVGAAVPTGADGKATSNALTANATAGSYAITAAAAGTTSASFAMTNRPLAAATALTLANAGQTTAGQPDAGDTIAVTFSQALAPGSVCTGWTGTSPLGHATVTMSRTGNGVDATMSVSDPADCPAFAFGTIDLGSPDFFAQGSSRSGSFTGSTVAYDAATRRLTITLGTYAGATRGAVAGSTATFTPAGALKDADGAPVAATPVSTTGQQF